MRWTIALLPSTERTLNLALSLRQILGLRRTIWFGLNMVISPQEKKRATEAALWVWVTLPKLD